MCSRSRGPHADRSDRAPRRVVRFDLGERLLHWSTAAIFLVLIATSLPLYFPQVESLVGRRSLMAHVHLWAGVALPLPMVVAVAGPWGARLRRDLRRFNLWSSDEVRWLRRFGRGPWRVTDKFNPGQKLNALFVAGSIVVMLGTGLIMQWYGLFALTLRTGATFVHDLLATALVVVIVGHVVFALAHPASLRSMFSGTVREEWAARHASAWLEETKDPANRR